MHLIRVAAPVNSLITLEEAKHHLHVDFDDDDAPISRLVDAAAQRLDGPDGYLGRCLITQTWKLTLDCFPPEITLPLPPCQSISSITFVDPDGATQTLDPSGYQSIGLGGTDPTRIRPAFGRSWPSVRTMPEAIAITFVAGYGDNPQDVPEPIRAAALLRVGHLYEHRESVVTGDSVAGLPLGEDDLTRNYRVWGF